MLTNEPFRNHRSVVVKNTIIATVVALMVFVWTVPEYPLISLGGMLAMIVITIIFSYIYWKKTLITITDEDIIVQRDTVFKVKKTIPFIKIASINADRDIIDRIFGTTKLKVNINSSKNAAVPEAVLTLDSSYAEMIRAELSERIFNQTFNAEEYNTTESAVKFTNGDVVLHGLFSLSSYQTLFAVILLAYSVIGAIFFENEDLSGVIAALFMLVVVEIIPMVFLIIRYYNFKVFRTGDTIHIQHGAIQNYHSSFEIGRVNAIRIRRTFFARLLGKAYVEAEVVGLGSGDGNIRPMISILSKEANIETIMNQIVPEFILQNDPVKQPATAKWPLLINAAIALIIVMPIMAFATIFVRDIAVSEGLTGYMAIMAEWAIPAAMVLIVVIVLMSIWMSMRLREFDMGDDLFTFRNGLLDREEIVMNYDKVQIVEIRSGIPAKRFGLARCKVSVLSAIGGTSISSGFFPEDDLSRISDRMLERVRARLGQ